MPTAVEQARAAQQELLNVTADRWPGEPATETDRIARLLIAAWEKVEGKPVPVSQGASFADVARVVVADAAAQVHDARTTMGLTPCIHQD